MNDDCGGGEPPGEDENSVLLRHWTVVVLVGRVNDDGDDSGGVETNAEAALRNLGQVVGEEEARVRQRGDGVVENAKFMVENAESFVSDPGHEARKQGSM